MTTKQHEPTSKQVAFYTLGCKANQLESSTLADDFTNKGWQVVPFDESASVYVINTCTVTERSDKESQRIIRRARLSNPEGKIVVTGCYAQVASDEVAALEGVDFVIGNNFKEDIRQIIETTHREKQEGPLVQVSDIDKSRIMVGATRSDLSRTRGSLKIQDGCDYKCTYCIIWEARGKSRSLPIDDLKTHLTRMVDDGFKEIVLTGINIGQYDDNGADLADLLQALIAIPKDFRLRLTSLDPLEVPEKLIQVVADSQGKICPHFHLSAQSAQDDVLKQMARRHHVADMIQVCQTIAEKIPNASIGSDIIVGFPGETDEQFEETVRVLKSVPMNYFHVFSYSKRRGTPAASLENQIPESVKKSRANQLKALSEEKQTQYRQRFIGQSVQVIVEKVEDVEKNIKSVKTETIQKSMSENYLRIILKDPHQLSPQPNDKARVQITHLEDEKTYGIIEALIK